MTDMARARVLVSGRVQGVFFRDTVQRFAHERGVSGWVRNLPDGRVEAEFQATEDVLDELIRLCQVGPNQAEVTDLAVDYLQPVEDEQGFWVR